MKIFSILLYCVIGVITTTTLVFLFPILGMCLVGYVVYKTAKILFNW
jgi:hypothetical protein